VPDEVRARQAVERVEDDDVVDDDDLVPDDEEDDGGDGVDSRPGGAPGSGPRGSIGSARSCGS
jgi:hypothetical protein